MTTRDILMPIDEVSSGKPKNQRATEEPKIGRTEEQRRQKQKQKSEQKQEQKQLPSQLRARMGHPLLAE
jgi:hypothetical protein